MFTPLALLLLSAIAAAPIFTAMTVKTITNCRTNHRSRR
ncbi:hypothetical protein RHDC3_02083 [Rhodocyclaceae bacterium]|jgi:hypothetical protein|nr:hypothetical protein RHDC3_02083 [Rhodocyclaceae bacterium]